jgi:DNA-binding NtrC family response regulator
MKGPDLGGSVEHGRRPALLDRPQEGRDTTMAMPSHLSDRPEHASRPAGPDDAPSGLPGVISGSSIMLEVARVTRQVARSRACVLIVGETGAGKELIARAIHDLSPRASGPYIRVNCGALTESLLESELFGHVKGSFTGAVENRTGRFEAAHTGTIFLDEINSTSPKLQVKLLRVLQEGEFERVGDVSTKKVDVRVVAATNRDLREEIDAGRFREDLYYRLNVVPIDLPPLRDRRDDVPPLVTFFLARFCEQNQREMRRVDPEAMKLLVRYDWPGNVRELQNYVERAVVLGEGPELKPEHLPPQLRGEAPPRPIRGRSPDLDTLITDLVRRGLLAAGPNADELIRRIVAPVERELIQQVLTSCDRVQIKAAARLGINRNTLHKKLTEYGLDTPTTNGEPSSPAPAPADRDES